MSPTLLFVKTEYLTWPLVVLGASKWATYGILLLDYFILQIINARTLILKILQFTFVNTDNAYTLFRHNVNSYKSKIYISSDTYWYNSEKINKSQWNFCHFENKCVTGETFFILTIPFKTMFAPHSSLIPNGVRRRNKVLLFVLKTIQTEQKNAHFSLKCTSLISTEKLHRQLFHSTRISSVLCYSYYYFNLLLCMHYFAISEVIYLYN